MNVIYNMKSIKPEFLLVTLLFGMTIIHVLVDFYLQGKQWRWYVDIVKYLYNDKYRTALLARSFMWSFMIHILFLILYTLNYKIFLSIIINTILHYIIDDLSNNLKINLIVVQLTHLEQIYFTIIIPGLSKALPLY